MVGAARAGARQAAFPVLLLQGMLDRVVGDHGRRVGQDERVEAIKAEERSRLRDDEMVAAGPGGTRRTVFVDQEQHQCSEPPAHQSFGVI